MAQLLSAKSAIALGAAATVGALGGYTLGLIKRKKSGRPRVWKSYECKDPLVTYAAEHSLRLLPVQEKLKAATFKHRMHGMMGAPEVCQLLQNLIRVMNAKKVIEIGVFTGFTTLGFGLALPKDGKIVACDISDEFMQVGKPYWKEAGIDHKIDIRLQPAIRTLDELLKNGEAGSYDLVFIDADKDNYETYFEKSLQLIRKGGVIAIDNVLWSGSVVEENPTRPGAAHIKMLNDKLKTDQRIEISFLAIADGLTLAIKK